MNRYSYCLNNPLTYVDPTGHFSVKAFFQSLVSGLVGGVVFAVTENPVLAGIAAGAVGGAFEGKITAVVQGAAMGGAMGAVPATFGTTPSLAAGVGAITYSAVEYGPETLAYAGASIAGSVAGNSLGNWLLQPTASVQVLGDSYSQDRSSALTTDRQDERILLAASANPRPHNVICDVDVGGTGLGGFSSGRGWRAKLPPRPSGMVKPQRHHDLPKKFLDTFKSIFGKGFNIHDPAHGRWVEGGPVGGHQKWSQGFNKEWTRFFSRNPQPTPEQTLRQMEQLRHDPRFQ